MADDSYIAWDIKWNYATPYYKENATLPTKSDLLEMD